jgi:uncharacterized protein (DUF885 family)
MDLCDKYLVDQVNIYPPMNDYLQYTKFLKRKGILPNHLSKQFNKKSTDVNEKYLKDLKKKKELSFCERVLKHDLGYDEKIRFSVGEYLIDINDNILFMYYDICINKLPPLSSKDDYVMVINRMKSLSGITSDMIKIMEKGIKKKVVMNKLVVQSFLDKSRSILDDKINPKNVPNTIKSQFIKAIQKYIINNIKRLNTFVTNEYLSYCIDDIGLCAYAGGKKYYELLCKQEILPNLTPDTIHQFGIKELKRDLALKKKLADKIGCEDIDDYMYKHNKYFKTSDEIMKLLEIQRKNQHSKLHKLFFQDIDKLYDIKPIAEYNMNMTAYYIGPNKSNGGVGTFFMNVMKPKRISHYELLVLSIHEGVPGHHYEGHLLYKSDKSDYVKNTLYSGYSEGWGLYCESLYEYTNWKEYYYSLQYRIERSLRLIIDTGIHYYGWNYDKCFDYMKSYLKNESDSFIDDQILRYSANPVQALTYKIGEQVILFLKKEFMKKNKDLKAFHKIILDIGPCPLELLIEKFRENIM